MITWGGIILGNVTLKDRWILYSGTAVPTIKTAIYMPKPTAMEL